MKLQIDALGAHDIRTVQVDGEPWFVATDIATVLGRSSGHLLTKGLAPDEKGDNVVITLGGPQTLAVVSEWGR